MKCCQRTKPQSYSVLLQLPPLQLASVFERCPEMRAPLLQHVLSFTPHQVRTLLASCPPCCATLLTVPLPAHSKLTSRTPSWRCWRPTRSSTRCQRSRFWRSVPFLPLGPAGFRVSLSSDVPGGTGRTNCSTATRTRTRTGATAGNSSAEGRRGTDGTGRGGATDT